MDESLIVSIGPHIKFRNSTKRIMWAVGLSLIPAGAAGVFIFGAGSLFIIAAAVLSAVLTEAAITALRRQGRGTARRAPTTIYDGSAVLTGLLLAYNLPPQAPLWLPLVGSFFAIAIGKQVFGGLGHNIFNPALVGRAFLMVSWPLHMTVWQGPRWQADALTSATPLALFKQKDFGLLNEISKWDLFIGNRGGCIGEVCVLALLIGAAYLLLRGYITWHIPVIYITTVGSMSWVFNGRGGLFTGDILFSVLSGGLMLGAFFMATDYVTSPLSARGKAWFGIGCGLLTFIIRRFTGYPEGVSYAILIMNAFVPIIDRYTFPKWFGKKP